MCLIFQENPTLERLKLTADPVLIIAEVHDINGIRVLGETIELSQLQPIQHVHTNLRYGRRHCKSEMDLAWLSRHCLAIVLFVSLSGTAHYI